MFRIRRKIGGGSFSDLSGLGDASGSRYRCTAVTLEELTHIL